MFIININFSYRVVKTKISGKALHFSVFGESFDLEKGLKKFEETH